MLLVILLGRTSIESCLVTPSSPIILEKESNTLSHCIPPHHPTPPHHCHSFHHRHCCTYAIEKEEDRKNYAQEDGKENVGKISFRNIFHVFWKDLSETHFTCKYFIKLILERHFMSFRKFFFFKNFIPKHTNFKNLI